MSQPTLMESLRFTAADLVANRKGKMTKAQKGLLREKMKFYVIVGGAFCVIFLIFFGACIVQFDTHTSSAAITSIMMTLGFGGLTIVFSTSLVNGIWNMRTDIKETFVAIFEGPISLHLQSSRVYRLQIKDARLIIPQDAIPELDLYKDYVVYYAPKSKIVLSLEEL